MERVAIVHDIIIQNDDLRKLASVAASTYVYNAIK
jgi:hypothetical protein